MAKKRENTKCFQCQNAVPSKTRGCSWSKNLIPVKGWEAIPRIYRVGGKTSGVSYRVVSCPEFIPDPSREPSCY